MTDTTPVYELPLPSDQSRISAFPFHLRSFARRVEEVLPSAVFGEVRAQLPAAVSRATNAILTTAQTALSAATRATSTASNAAERVTALESAAGFGPSTPEDGTVADLVAQTETLTSAAVDTAVGGLLSTATSAAGASLAGVLAGAGMWAGAGTETAPRIVDEVELLRDTGGRLADGSAWFSPIRVGHLPGTWLDQWYGYVSGHDSKAIWLVTAPDLLGPWTWREAVVGVPGSGARLEEPSIQAHASTPDAVVEGTVIHLLFHGPKASTILEQPTLLATSKDGRQFTSAGIVLDTEWGNGGSPYRTSVSYVTTCRHGGLRHAIWQGTTGRNAVQDGTAYTPLPVGYATSVDGLTWIKRPPIIPSLPGDQGLLAPGFVRLPDGWLVVGTYRSRNAAGGQDLNVRCYAGPTLDALTHVGNIVLPQPGRTQEIVTPTFHVHRGRLWMIGGVRPPGSNVRTVTAFALDWS